MKAQNEMINRIKLVAIILVIVNHTILYYIEFSPTSILYEIEFVLCRTAVPLFLMCTGYLLCNRDINIKSSFKRIIRILIPLIFWSFLIFCLREKKISFEFIINFIQNPIIEQYWYLYMLLGLYLIIPYINNMIKNINNKNLLLLIFLIFIPSIFALLKFSVSSYFTLTTFSYIIGYYLIGALFSRLDYIKMIHIIAYVLFFISFFIGIFYFKNIELFYIDNFYIVLLSTTLFIIIYGTSSSTSSKKKIKNYSKLSNLIFGVYLIHPLLQNKIYNLGFVQFVFQKNANIGLLFLQSLVIIICFIIVYLFKKMFALFYYKIKKS